jgi:hypothetical protein
MEVMLRDGTLAGKMLFGRPKVYEGLVLAVL